MEISNSVSTPSLNVNPNEARNIRSSNAVNQNSYKEAFKLDINPKYLGSELEKVAIADSEVLFYNNQLELTKKP